MKLSTFLLFVDSICNGMIGPAFAYKFMATDMDPFSFVYLVVIPFAAGQFITAFLRNHFGFFSRFASLFGQLSFFACLGSYFLFASATTWIEVILARLLLGLVHNSRAVLEDTFAEKIPSYVELFAFIAGPFVGCQIVNLGGEMAPSYVSACGFGFVFAIHLAVSVFAPKASSTPKSGPALLKVEKGSKKIKPDSPAAKNEKKKMEKMKTAATTATTEQSVRKRKGQQEAPEKEEAKKEAGASAGKSHPYLAFVIEALSLVAVEQIWGNTPYFVTMQYDTHLFVGQYALGFASLCTLFALYLRPKLLPLLFPKCIHREFAGLYAMAFLILAVCPNLEFSFICVFLVLFMHTIFLAIVMPLTHSSGAAKADPLASVPPPSAPLLPLWCMALGQLAQGYLTHTVSVVAPFVFGSLLITLVFALTLFLPVPPRRAEEEESTKPKRE